MKEVIISKEESNQRVDKYLMKYLSDASKGFIYKMLRKKRIKLNKKRIQGHEILMEQDILHFYMAEETIDKFSHEVARPKKDMAITFRVLYEDEHILICHKPVGLLSQPDHSGDISLVEEVTAYLMMRGEYDPDQMKGFRPGISNRLDRNTSGIVLCGKHLQAVQELNKLIANKAIDKHYQCLVVGKVTEGQEIEGYLKKDESLNKVWITNDAADGYYIKTIYEPLHMKDNYTLLDVQIITGKSHQIRAHLSSIGHPLVGDYKYGTKNVNELFKVRFELTHQLLHAYKIMFHVESGILSYLNNKIFVDPIEGMFKKITERIMGTR